MFTLTLQKFKITNQIDVEKLNNEQLMALYKQTEVNSQSIQKSIPVLRRQLDALNDSLQCLNSLKNQKEGNTLLMPISESAYVHGQVVDAKKVTIAIGGNYAAELPIEDAIKFYENRKKICNGKVQKIRDSLSLLEYSKQQLSLEIKLRFEKQQQQNQQTPEHDSIIE